MRHNEETYIHGRLCKKKACVSRVSKFRSSVHPNNSALDVYSKGITCAQQTHHGRFLGACLGTIHGGLLKDTAANAKGRRKRERAELEVAHKRTDWLFSLRLLRGPLSLRVGDKIRYMSKGAVLHFCTALLFGPSCFCFQYPPPPHVHPDPNIRRYHLRGDCHQVTGWVCADQPLTSSYYADFMAAQLLWRKGVGASPPWQMGFTQRPA